MTNCCLGNYCKSPNNKPGYVCGICRKPVHSVHLGCAVGPAGTLSHDHHVYLRTRLPFGDPCRLSEAATVCLACSENQTKNIIQIPLEKCTVVHEKDGEKTVVKRDSSTDNPRKRYSLEDKYDVVVKINEDGSNRKEVATEFGLNKATVNTWWRQKTSIIKQCKGIKERQRLSYEDKLRILAEVKPDKSNKKEIMDQYGIKKHTLNTWLRQHDEIARTCASSRMSSRKANYHSPIWRIHEAVDRFFTDNLMKVGKARITITGFVLGQQATKIKEELLAQHARKDIELTEQELKHLSKFKGSDSWGRKYAKAKGWKKDHCKVEASIKMDGMMQLPDSSLKLSRVPNRSMKMGNIGQLPESSMKIDDMGHMSDGVVADAAMTKAEESFRYSFESIHNTAAAMQQFVPRNLPQEIPEHALNQNEPQNIHQSDLASTIPDQNLVRTRMLPVAAALQMPLLQQQENINHNTSLQPVQTNPSTTDSLQPLLPLADQLSVQAHVAAQPLNEIEGGENDPMEGQLLHQQHQGQESILHGPSAASQQEDRVHDEPNNTFMAVV